MDPLWSVRYRVAENEYVHIDTLVRLARDENYSVRCAVTRHPKVPISILVDLSTDQNLVVVFHAKKNLADRNILEDLLDDHG